MKPDQSQQRPSSEDVTLIRKADLENHNKDGGMWTVIHGKVYDIQDFKTQAPCGSDLLVQFAGQWGVLLLRSNGRSVLKHNIGIFRSLKTNCC